jgi:hypothetical protein
MSAFLSEIFSRRTYLRKSYATRVHVSSEEHQFPKIFFRNELTMVREEKGKKEECRRQNSENKNISPRISGSKSQIGNPRGSGWS